MREKKEFNFAQRWVDGLVRGNKSPAKWKNQALLWGTVSLLLLGAVGSTPWIWEYRVQREITLVEQKIAPLGEISNQVTQLKALKIQAAEQQQLLELLQKNTRDPGPILDKLKDYLPVGTVVNTFTLQENALTLGVSVPTPVDVAVLWVGLRDSGMFQAVDIQTVSLQDKAQALTLKLQLK